MRKPLVFCWSKYTQNVCDSSSCNTSCKFISARYARVFCAHIRRILRISLPYGCWYGCWYSCGPSCTQQCCPNNKEVNLKGICLSTYSVQLWNVWSFVYLFLVFRQLSNIILVEMRSRKPFPHLWLPITICLRLYFNPLKGESASRRFCFHIYSVISHLFFFYQPLESSSSS